VLPCYQVADLPGVLRFEPPPSPADEPGFDPDLPPPPSKYSLAIDLGSTRLRYSVFSTDDFAAALDACARLAVGVSLRERGRARAPGFTPLLSLRRLFGRKFADAAVAPAVGAYPLRVVETR
jgi:hypothetical protein